MYILIKSIFIYYFTIIRIPFKDVTKEVDALRNELNTYKETLEGSDLEVPHDLAVQMNTFIPVIHILSYIAALC